MDGAQDTASLHFRSAPEVSDIFDISNDPH